MRNGWAGIGWGGDRLFAKTRYTTKMLHFPALGHDPNDSSVIAPPIPPDIAGQRHGPKKVTILATKPLA